MRALLKLALTAAGLSLAAGLQSAWAQSVDTGNEVQVNPTAAGRGILLYPGGQYMRVVPQLLQPGQNDGPIRLHMPVHHRAVHIASAAPPPAPEPAPAPERKPRHKAVKVASAPPPVPVPAPTRDATPSLFGGPTLSLTPTAPVAKPAPKLASAAPPPAETPGMTKRSVILFSKGSTEPAETAISAIKFLAGDLNASMVRLSSRVEIQAYGGDKGDKGSDARRLSLKRALAIRQVLMDAGVPSDRIDVRAMGGADDTGPADRVDVFVKA